MEALSKIRKTLSLHYETIGAIAVSLVIIGLIIFTAYSLGFASHDVAIVSDEGPGFWMGLWHGIIAPIALIASIFSNDITMFATPNNGFFYSLGFLMGSGTLVKISL